MRSINKVIIIGNLTRDPEMRQTPNGQNVTTFGVATNRDWMTKEGDRKNSAEFHECVAWSRLAEICSQYLHKGQLVYIEGYLKTRSWDSPEGIKKFKTEIVVKDMIRLEKRSRDENGDDYMPQDEAVDYDDANNEVAIGASAQSANGGQGDDAAQGDDATQSTAAQSENSAQSNQSSPQPEAAQSENIIDKDLGL